jgi:thiamine-monophosphate kinase
MASEFEFLEELRRKFNRPDKRIVTGIGDDGAVIRPSARQELVVSSDMLVEDIDFKLDWITPQQLGRKALAVSLSDIAAMGANPVWSMTSLGIPKALWQEDFLKEFYQGWQDLASKHNVALVGGDISKTPDKLVIDSVVGGTVRKGRAVTRAGAKPGDQIYVSGALGGAAAGLRLLQSGSERTPAAGKLIARHLRPEPRCQIGATLGELKIASAMIDLSDGLSSDLGHLCHESGVGARIFQDKLPVDRNLRALGFADEMELVLHGGEDFELLFTAPRRLRKDLRNKLAKLPVTEIGEITEGNKLEIEGPDGIVELELGGYKHF